MPTPFKPTRWTVAPRIEPNADVILAFHGLMCLCNHNSGFCEVGILNTDPGKHDLFIFLLEVSPLFDPPTNVELGDYRLLDVFDVSHTGKAHTDIVRFDVIRPRVQGVAFYQPDRPPKEDPNDFRLIIDLEGPDFYHGIELGKNHAALGPRLHIADATFYTLCKTNAKFKAQEGTSTPKDIDSVARVIGANIYLDRTPAHPGKVFLTIDNGPPITLPTSPDKKNLIFIDNSCPHVVCRDQSDFPLYYDAVKVPLLRKKFTIEKVPDPPGTPPAPAGLCALINNLSSVLAGFAVKEGITASDDTPCGPAGAGTSGGLGPPT